MIILLFRIILGYSPLSSRYLRSVDGEAVTKIPKLRIRSLPTNLSSQARYKAVILCISETFACLKVRSHHGSVAFCPSEPVGYYRWFKFSRDFRICVYQNGTRRIDFPILVISLVLRNPVRRLWSFVLAPRVPRLGAF